eukprot:scaffold17843_cov131-Isochrysis_galbana.AAC.4
MPGAACMAWADGPHVYHCGRAARCRLPLACCGSLSAVVRTAAVAVAAAVCQLFLRRRASRAPRCANVHNWAKGRGSLESKETRDAACVACFAVYTSWLPRTTVVDIAKFVPLPETFENLGSTMARPGIALECPHGTAAGMPRCQVVTQAACIFDI